MQICLNRAVTLTASSDFNDFSVEKNVETGAPRKLCTLGSDKKEKTNQTK
jgi:hypothetical protein